MQNVTAGPAFSNNQEKIVNDPDGTHNENVQIATLYLTSVGKISLMMIHVTGPVKAQSRL